MTTRDYRVLGVDPGFAGAPTGAALVAFAEAGPRVLKTSTITSGKAHDWQEKVVMVLEALARLITITTPDLIVYELAWVGQNNQTALRMESLGGGVRGLAVAQGVPCVGVAPALSKQALTGQHNANKALMIQTAKVLFGLDLSEHEADAIGHALAGEAQQRRVSLVRAAKRGA